MWATIYGVTQSWTQLKLLSSSSSRILSKTHIKSELCLLQAPLAETVTPTSLVLDDFDVLGSTAQRHSRTPCDLTGAQGFGEEDHRDE